MTTARGPGCAPLFLGGRSVKSLLHLEDRQSLHERLRSLTPQDRPQWGVMNASMMLMHLRQAFRGACGELEVPALPAQMPRRAYKYLALRVVSKWPPNVETTPQMKILPMELCAEKFAQAREDVIARMERFSEPQPSPVRHPIFGAMSYEDWMRWGFLHTDHHLRQFGR